MRPNDAKLPTLVAPSRAANSRHEGRRRAGRATQHTNRKESLMSDTQTISQFESQLVDLGADPPRQFRDPRR